MKMKSYINGEFIDSNKTIGIISPLNNKVFAEVQALKEDDIDRAFNSAEQRFNTWKKTPLEERISYIERFKEAMEENADKMAEIMNHEIAKKVKDGITEIRRTIEYIDQTIEQWRKYNYSSIKIKNKKANIYRVPLGVVLAISPFNYPVNLSISKIIPALIVGNTVVFKPATNGSVIGSFLGKLFHQAGFPAGTINVVTGRGSDIGDFLVSHNNISMISFTGSIKVGKNIARQKSLIPIVLELGGNDAAYVRYDADIDLAVKEIVKGAFSYSGQRCTAIKKLILHKDIKEEFISKLLEEIKKISLDPLVTINAAKFVEELVEDSINRGDEFILKGNIKDNVVTPFIVEVKSTKSRTWREEAFGPLLPIYIIDNEDKLIEIFNDTNYGLQNSIFTSNINFAKKLSLQIESGTVNINRSSSRGPDIFPFLGIKDSGFGTQGIIDALLSMTRILNIVEND